MCDEMGEQCPERGAAHGPTVDEEHGRAAAPAPIGDFSGADVEEPIGCLPEQIRRRLRSGLTTEEGDAWLARQRVMTEVGANVNG